VLPIGLLLIRVVVGLLFMGHGAQKLFGWFGGKGLRGMGAQLEGLGYRPGYHLAWLAGLSEAGGGLLLALGFLTPFGAAAIIGMMVSATLSVHLEKGLWNTAGGFELPLVYATVALALAFVGPGRLSLDRAFGWPLRGLAWGLLALILGVGVALSLDVWRSANLRRTAPTEPVARPEGHKRPAA
jgi:putative oxidoreductase